jgi:hypothetical protein
MIRAARKKPTSSDGRSAIACWFSRVAETNARRKKKTQDHKHRIVGVRYCPAEKDMDASDPPRNYQRVLLLPSSGMLVASLANSLRNTVRYSKLDR